MHPAVVQPAKVDRTKNFMQFIPKAKILTESLHLATLGIDTNYSESLFPKRGDKLTTHFDQNINKCGLSTLPIFSTA